MLRAISSGWEYMICSLHMYAAPRHSAQVELCSLGTTVRAVPNFDELHAFRIADFPAPAASDTLVLYFLDVYLFLCTSVGF